MEERKGESDSCNVLGEGWIRLYAWFNNPTFHVSIEFIFGDKLKVDPFKA